MSESAKVSKFPDCDMCMAIDKQTGIQAVYDGKTNLGPWANMCEKHYRTFGIGLGTGKGQKFILR